LSKLHRSREVGSLRHVTQILVIEDDRDIRDLIGQVLSDEGYELTFVDGLDRAPADAVPDLVITDLVGLRPYASGLARAWVRRVKERYPAAPIIVCTAHEPAFEELDRLGAAALLGKPFTIAELLRTVDELITR
jgi:two-component system nitrogen regulation response regulator NtrX